MIAALALLACTEGKLVGGDTGSDTEPTEPTEPTEEPGAVTLEGVPAAARSGEPWPTVTVRAPGRTGTVTLDGVEGAAELVDGVAVFDGLTSYGCGVVEVVARIDGASSAPVETERTAAWSLGPAPPAAALGAFGPWTATLVGWDGAPVPVDGLATLAATSDARFEPDAPITAPLVGGVVTFDGVFGAAGAFEGALTVDAGSCAPEPASWETFVGASTLTRPIYLPSARVGSPWSAALPPAPGAVASGAPGWLTVDPDTGAWFGVPDAEGAVTVEVVGVTGDVVDRQVVHLAVFPADDPQPTPAVTPSDPGPFDAASELWTIPSITVSTGTYRDVEVWVTYPVDGGLPLADPRPLVAFHHAAHGPPDIFDDYTALHGHWASHGVVVVSVDSQVNVSGQSQSWQNLADMSVFQRAALDLALATADSGAWGGAIDVDRLFVAGHSRGGGASLISLWEDPRLAGALCFMQVSPLQTPDQDWGDPLANGDRPFPARPILFLSGSDDRDEPWPLVDTAFAQTTGPTAFITEMGTNHEGTYDFDTPGGRTSVSQIPLEDRHALDQHFSTSFLYRFAYDDLAYDPLLFGVDALSSDLSDQGVVTYGRRFMASAIVVDDFQDDDPDTNPLGGEVATGATAADGHPFEVGLAAAGRGDERSDRIAVWAQARSLQWSGTSDLTLSLTPGGDGLDLIDQRRLAWRMFRDCAPPPSSGTDRGCAEGPLDVQVTLTDASGAEATVDAADGTGANGVKGRYAGDTLLPLDAFAGVDLSAVTSVRVALVATSPAVGDVWIDDLRFE
jgi:hypothetical protein